MIDSFHSLRLREEARKSWDYFFTDELVYAIEPHQIDGEGHIGYIERYIHSELYLDLTFRWNLDTSYETIIECANLIDIPHVTETNRSLNEARENFPMFVDSVNFMKPPEMFYLRPIPSVVRLKAFYNRMGSWKNITQFPISPASWVLIARDRIKDGELCVSIRFRGDKKSELPSQMVERRTKVVGKIANDGTPFNGGFPLNFISTFKPIIFKVLFKFLLSDHFTWLESQESLGFSVQEVEMFLRPDNLKPNAVERMHIVSSVNEEI